MDKNYLSVNTNQISSSNSKNENVINPVKLGEKCAFFLIRHAERSDSTDMLLNRRIKNDPEITEFGKSQTKDTANEI